MSCLARSSSPFFLRNKRSCPWKVEPLKLQETHLPQLESDLQLQSRRSRGRTQIPPMGTRGRGKLTRAKALHPEFGVYCASPKARAGKHWKPSQMEQLATAQVLLEALFSFYVF